MSESETLDLTRLTEQQQRSAIVAEAKTWVGTPYISNAAIKGVGIDCAMILLKTFSDVGLIEWFDPRPYPAQWALHQSAEVYLGYILKFAGEITVDEVQEGDVAVFQFGKCWAHAAIILDWPELIHANPPGMCRYDNYERNSQLKRRRPRFFSYWAPTGRTLE